MVKRKKHYPCGEKHHRWKGGRSYTGDGYIRVYLSPDNLFYSMADHDGRVLEHRLVVAKRLNRCLLKSEPVHHINGIKDDNRDENLEILNKGSHMLRTRFCHDCELKKEIRLLRWQMMELQKQLQGKLI